MKTITPIFLLFLFFHSSIHTIQSSDKFTITEATIQDIQTAFKQNKLTSKELVLLYIRQIQKFNPILKAVIELNPDALHQAEKADQERKANSPKSRFGLHGIPILLKDNIATKDQLNTTAGSYALLKSVVPRDAGVVKKLRESGAIILGKASLSEWAHFRSSLAPSGWNARVKQAVNPYLATLDPCGSSTGSGISVATNMVTVTLGTETDGSILCPSSANSVVGIKPTVGLTSRAGVIPISPRQDTVGKASKYIPKGGYLNHLISHGLKGKRLGVMRAYPFFGFSNDTKTLNKFEKHFATKWCYPRKNLEINNFDQIVSMFNGEIPALLFEFKIVLNAYLKELVASPVRSLADVIAFNKKFSKLEKIKEYPQDFFLAAEATNEIGRLEKETLMNLTRASKDGFEKLMKENKLDALVTPNQMVPRFLLLGGYPESVYQVGKRLGIMRAYPYFGFANDTKTLKKFEKHFDILSQSGATLVENMEIVNLDHIVSMFSSEFIAILAEFKIALNAYQKELVASPVRSLADNPYLATFDPCGSSTGSAISVATNMVTVSLGTETDGSILCPSSANSVVGIKPTVGLTSRAGVIPISPRQDSVGPICRTVADAVYVLDAIVGFDNNDAEATREASQYIPKGGYLNHLISHGLKGKRLGIMKAYPYFGFNNDTETLKKFEKHFDILRQSGATLLENVEIDNFSEIVSMFKGESKALLFEFKIALNAYLKELEASPVRSLADVIAFNEKFSDLENIKEYPQDLFLAAEDTNGVGDLEKETLLNLTRASKDGFEKLMKENELDALVTPNSAGSTVLAIGGYPGISVPAGYDKDGAPYGYGADTDRDCLWTIQTSGFTITEATIQDIQTAFKQNSLTSKELVQLYIQQIQNLNSTFRAVIELNPDAVQQAEAADQERKANTPKSRLALHGIPILLKDNIATKDKLKTTAGSYALLDSVVPVDAGVVKKLRESGAIILGKASLSEWANFRSSSAPSGWNARTNQAINPYVATADPCGSSTGSAISVATNMVTVSLGTETAGSILCPSSANSVVGIKPTVGLTSRAGVIPISPRQDTEMINEYPQDIFLEAEKTTGIGNVEKEILMNFTRASEDGFEKLMIDNKLDALVTPNADGSLVLAIGGYPGISVPSGYDDNGAPYGICFGGLKGSEPKLIEIA
ncbi:hypothetical protein OSB04_021927 [Centaurea solstitialis]|uniref:Amidase domain-containing protein n=1 Tax=Centaurea solstitialis TaxID=347529 RepID=A0AA38SWR9_9ASTR|nr:hypothetical protein OSB04_021927 [Centaurea solstitialis]